MRKSLLFVPLFFAFTITNAQLKKKYGDYQSPFAIGLKAGLTTPTYLGGASNDLVKRTWNYGFGFGMFAVYNATDILSLEAELLFIQGGYTQSFELTELEKLSKYTNKALLSYMQLPILAKLRFGSDAVKFTVYAGPYLGLATGGRVDSKIESEGETVNTVFNLGVKKGELSSFDVGAIVGIGMRIKAGSGVFVTDLRTNLGFVDIFDNEPKPNGDGKPTTNLIPSLTIGYMIFVGN